METSRTWKGYWINTGKVCNPAALDDLYVPAPYLRKTFVCKKHPKKAIAYVAGLGWHELYVNGKKADDRVLSPVVTQYDRHVSYIEYDITKLLKTGKNAVAVLLGNGWYDCATHEVWCFDKAPWRDTVKLLCDIEADGTLLAKTDESWKQHDSPIRLNQLRNGEIYDAAFEIPGFAEADLDDSDWKQAVQCNPPGGLIVREELEPCKISDIINPAGSVSLDDGSVVYDFGRNMTGWCRIRVRGEKGAQVKLVFSEKIHENGDIDPSNIEIFTKKGEFQANTYRLKGTNSAEEWEPRFTYNGFRYVKAICSGFSVRIDKIEACFIHNSFAEAGAFDSSDKMLNALQQCTRQSYLSNFTGIPTDCPHREKNGWTGDAQLASETGLWNFMPAKAYEHFIRIVCDTQRPNGQLPGIAPSGGWGYNWGSGPAWDSILFEVPWQVWRFTGNDAMIREHYDSMRRYLQYCVGMSEDNLIRFGLGDWCHNDHSRMAPIELTSTGYFYYDAMLMCRFAKLLDKKEDVRHYTALAADIRKSFNKKFYKGKGVFGNGEMASIACAVYTGLAEDKVKPLAAAKLADLVEANGCKVDFGILGAKYVPRVLSDYGYASLAFKLITQPEFPGWGFWIKSGATSLREEWNNSSSQNHIMFGDISAWMYQYLAGIVPIEPGFKRFTLKPCVIPELKHVSATHETPYGTIQSSWKHSGSKVRFEFSIPKGTVAELILPGSDEKIELAPGKHRI